MELSYVARALRRHWITALVVFTVVTLIGLSTVWFQPSRYAATATVLVQADPAAQLQVQVVSFMIPALVAQASSETFATNALEKVPAPLRDASVDVATVDPEGTGVLTVTARSEDRSAVAGWATAFAQELTESPTGARYIVIDLLDPARTPTSPYAPKRRPVAVSSVLLGAIFGVLAAIAAAAFRKRRAEAQEIRERFGTIVLGEVPPFKGFRQQGVADVLESGPVDVVEAIQALRTNVEFALQGVRNRSVAVISASTGEGKSTLAVGLSWALASVQVSVAAIDADLRRPTLHTHFGGKRSPGIASVHTVPVDKLLQRTQHPYLQFIAAGVPDRHPAEVLRENLSVVLERLAAEKITVVVDCPPFEGFSETGAIATAVGGVILVIDRRQRDLVDVERSIATLRDAGANVLGVVINRSKLRSAASSYYE